MPRAVGLPQAAAEELSAYWADSFGNSTRIDYGTGHETTFAALLFCLAKLGALSEGCLQVRGAACCYPPFTADGAGRGQAVAETRPVAALLCRLWCARCL